MKNYNFFESYDRVWYIFIYRYNGDFIMKCELLFEKIDELKEIMFWYVLEYY